jgi:hypothetical protein
VSGGATSLEVRVEPGTTPGQLRVGFFEEEVQGTGEQWKTSGWIAVLFGSMLEGVDPTDIAAIMNYQRARYFRDGTPNQQLQALSYYWQATMMAQVGLYMVES